MAVVTFVADTFRTLYPAFADETKVTDAMLNDCFALAESLVGNTDSSLVPYAPDASPAVLVRQQVLYLMTCHLATMRYLWDATQAGALSSASQGSVSAGFAVDTSNRKWWNSTQCGATAYLLLRRYISGGDYFGAVYVHTGG